MLWINYRKLKLYLFLLPPLNSWKTEIKKLQNNNNRNSGTGRIIDNIAENNLREKSSLTLINKYKLTYAQCKLVQREKILAGQKHNLATRNSNMIGLNEWKGQIYVLWSWILKLKGRLHLSYYVIF